MNRINSVVGLAFVAVVGGLVVWGTASASTRSVTGTWAAGGSGMWHGLNVLEVKGLSDVGTDCAIDLAIQDANGKFVSTFGATNDAANPFDGDDPVFLRSLLDEYGSGSLFTLTGTFRDSAGAVNATVTTTFTKP